MVNTATSATSAGPHHGRTAAAHWALSGPAARPECVYSQATGESAPGGQGSELRRRQEGDSTMRRSVAPPCVGERR